MGILLHKQATHAKHFDPDIKNYGFLITDFDPECIFSRRPTFDLKIALTLIGMCDPKFQSLPEFTTQHYHR